MEAIDIGFGGDGETTQAFRIGGASCAVPGAARGSRPCTRAYGRLPWAELLQPAIELARDGVELTRPQAHLHAILDLIIRHTDEGRRLYSRADGTRLAARRLCWPSPTWARRSRRSRPAAPRRSTGASWRIDRRDGRRRRRELTVADLEAYEVIWREPVRASLPRPRGDLEPAALVGRRPDRVRARPAGACRERGPGTAEALAALTEVMREQTRARGGSFTEDLYAGGLAVQLLDDDSVAAAHRADQASRCPVRRSTRRTAVRHTSPRSTPTATQPRSRRRPAPARA